MTYLLKIKTTNIETFDIVRVKMTSKEELMFGVLQNAVLEAEQLDSSGTLYQKYIKGFVQRTIDIRFRDRRNNGQCS